MRAPPGVVLVVVSGCHVSSPLVADAGLDASDHVDGKAPTADGAMMVDASSPTIEVLQGVDRAGAFSTTEAEWLKATYDVMWTGVYIGGACSAGSGWSKSVVTALHSAEGWLFMPIWVGQQAPSICSETTLTTAQGTGDGAATAAMMQTFGWAAHGDIPVVLDLEAGTYSYSEVDSTAYAKAWRDAVRAAGYLAYLYSSTTAISAFADGGVTFDGVWPASWDYDSFESVDPTSLTSLGSSYPGQTRAWQYAGNVSTTGAGGVDADVSDLLLAPAPGSSNN